MGKYEEALERARGIYNGNPSSATAKVVCEQIFPELKESEDERIRKEIVDEIKEQINNIPALDCCDSDDLKRLATLKSWIAYLEKQKDREALIRELTKYKAHHTQMDLQELIDMKKHEHLELKAGHWYICHRAFCCRADHLTVKEGERFQCEKDGIVKGFLIKEPEKYFKECSAPAPMEDELEVLDDPHWKPSEEQMSALNYFIKLWGKSDDQLEYTQIFNTVKSLRDELEKLM